MFPSAEFQCFEMKPKIVVTQKSVFGNKWILLIELGQLFHYNFGFKDKHGMPGSWNLSIWNDSCWYHVMPTWHIARNKLNQWPNFHSTPCHYFISSAACCKQINRNQRWINLVLYIFAVGMPEWVMVWWRCLPPQNMCCHEIFVLCHMISSNYIVEVFSAVYSSIPSLSSKQSLHCWLSCQIENCCVCISLRS